MTEPIIFQIIDWSQFHEGEPIEPEDELDELEDNNNELLHYKIRLFGRTDKGKSIYVNIDNFTPFFYVEIPNDWNQTKAFSLVNHIKSKITNPIVLKGFKNFDIVERKKFYGFTGYKTFKFLRLIFLNMKSFKAFEYWIDRNKINYPFLFKKPTKLSIYESNIEPFVRCMHIRKLNACGWVSVNKYKNYPEGTSYCDTAIRTDWTELNPHDSNSIQKFIIASYDIECMSESGDFPIATNDNDPIIQIGTVFSYYGESEPFFKSIITLGGCAKIKGLEDVEIQSYNDEKKVLLAWTKLIQEHDPDIITGYNINGFDFQYMKDRAEKLKILNRFNKLSRLQGEDAEYKIKQLASSALGENILKYFDMNGRVIIDLMKVAMRDFKLDSFKLDNVASTFIREKIEGYKEDGKECYVTTKSVYGIKEDDYVNIMWDDGLTENKHDQKYKILQITKDETDPKLYKMRLNGTIPDEAFYTEKHGGTTKKKNKTFWCHAKDDVSAKDLFKFQRGSDKDRGIIAKYCIMDCVLVTKLMEKTQVLNNNIGMANVCSVPLTYIFMRGQGVKIFSLVSKKCRELEHIMPRLKVKQKENPDDKFKKIKKNDDSDDDDKNDDTGYEGAIVFPPVKGVHYEPIPVLDYASLYPRSMILVNISQECFVMEPKYDNMEGYDYQTVTYNNNDGTTTTCRFAKKLDGTKGILPLILIELLDKRSATKKLMEKAAASGDNFAAAIYDGLQLAYKVTANSLYGQVGAPTSPIYMKELAASTTATGRKMLELSKTFIEGAFGKLINYALEDKNAYDNYALEVFDKDVYHKRPIQAKKWIEPKAGRNSKEEFINYFYKKVNEIISEEYRVSPQVIYGDSVTGDTPILLLNNKNKVQFMCIDCMGDNFTNYSVFKSEDPNLSEKEQDNTIDYKVWTDKGWAKVIRVIRHKTYKKIYEVITPKSYVKVTADHSLLDSAGNQIKPEECKIGQELLHNDNFENNYTQDKIIDNFMICYNKGFGCTDSDGNHFIEIDCIEEALESYYWAKLLDYFPIIEKKLDSFRISCWKFNEHPNPNNLIEINDLGYTEDYVYDLETEVGHFHAGIGSLIVKNTDSVFFSPKIHDIETKVIRTDRDVLPICIEIGMLAGDTICKVLPEPEEQVYEKTLWPFIILAKKKYVGNLYEDDDKVFKQKSMGIVLKRRDNAKIVKIVVGGIVDYILNGKPGETCIQDRNKGAIEYTRMLVKKILRGEFPIDKYIVSKTLRSTYKNRSGIVHAVLADRIGERDPGNKPDVNERVPYVYIVPKGKVNLQGDRVEDPKYVIEKGLELDYLFYITNQIMKPSIQFLELIAVNPEKLFDNYINKEINRRKNISSIMDYVCEDNLNILSNKSKSRKPSSSDDDDGSTQELIDELEEIEEEIEEPVSKSKKNKGIKEDIKKKNKETKLKGKNFSKTKSKEKEEESSSSDEEMKKLKSNNKSVKKSMIIEL